MGLIKKDYTHVDVKDALLKYLRESHMELYKCVPEVHKHGPFKSIDNLSLINQDNQACVYFQKHDKKVYIGETMHVSRRFKNHKYIDISEIFYLISSELFNKSGAYEIETIILHLLLLQNPKGIEINNSKLKQSSFNFYMKDVYEKIAYSVWDDYIVKGNLLGKGFKTSSELLNSSRTKVHPFLHPTEEQFEACKKILNSVVNDQYEDIVVHGSAGTGKTVVAVILAKQLIEDQDKTTLLSSGAKQVVRDIFNKIFSKNTFKKKSTLVIKVMKDIPDSIEELKSYRLVVAEDFLLSAIINKFGFETSKEIFDVSIIDEAHRMISKPGIQTTSQLVKVKKENETINNTRDVIEHLSHSKIFFYDEKQKLKKNDLNFIKSKDALELSFRAKLRMIEADNYIELIEAILNPWSDEEIKKRSLNNTLIKLNKVKGFEIKLFNKEDGIKSLDWIKSESKDMYDKHNKHNCRIMSTYCIKYTVRTKEKVSEILSQEKRDFMKMFNLPLTWNKCLETKWHGSMEAERFETVANANATQGLESKISLSLIGDSFRIVNENGKNKLIHMPKNIKDMNSNYYDSKDRGHSNTELAMNRLYVLLTRPMLKTGLHISDESLYNYIKKITC